MKRKIFSILFALVLVLTLGLVTAVPVSAAGPPTIDGAIGAGEWDGALEIPVASSMGTVKLLASTDYLFVLFDVTDSTDARLGQNLHGNDQTSININPTAGVGTWGFPYDLIFETSADLPWNPKDNSGIIDGWNTRWFPNDAQEALPVDLESATIYSGGKRITEWKLPLATIAPLPGDTLLVGGATEAGDAAGSYVYPVGLDWNNPSTFAGYWYGVNNQDTGLYYQTIQDAIDAASGTTLVCVSGVYNEDVTINKSLTLISAAGKDNTTINGQATGEAGAVRITSDSVVLGGVDAGFTINGAGVAAVYFSQPVSGCLVEGNDVVAADTKNALLFGGGQSTHTIRGNDFAGNASQLVYVNGMASVSVASTSVDFIGNTFAGTATGPALGQEATDSTISGNTFATVTPYASLELWGDGNSVTGNYFTADLPAGGLYLVDNPGTLDIDAVLSNNTFLRAVVVEHPGSSRLPKIWANIQDAVNAAVTDDTVDVAAGTYIENVVVNESLTLQGEDRGTTEIKFGYGNYPSEPPLIISADEVTVSGFTIRSGPYIEKALGATGGYAHTIIVTGDSALLTDLHVIKEPLLTYNNQPRIGGSAFLLTPGLDGFDFTDSTVDSAWNGIYAPRNPGSSDILVKKVDFTYPGEYAILLMMVTGATIEENTFTCNADKLGVIVTRGSDEIEIASNQFVGSGSAESHIGILLQAYAEGTMGEVVIVENEISKFHTGILVEDVDTSGISIHYNNITGNTYGVKYIGNPNMLDAINNWWGDASGPTASPGSGDPVSGNVTYDPWLLEPVVPGAPLPTTFDKTLTLLVDWTLVSTNNWIDPAETVGVDVILAYNYTPSEGYFEVDPADLVPVNALYLKTEDGGGLGITYSGGVPVASSKDLEAGWNLISSASLTNAKAVLSPLRFVQVGDEQGVGLTTVVSQGPFNLHTGSFYLATLTESDWDNIEEYNLNPFDGYWVYMNAGKNFGVVPSAKPDPTP